MNEWQIKRTDTFLKFLKKHKNNHQLFIELDKKINLLKQDPEKVGGYLSGRLYGLKSTRLVGKFRLLFRIDNNKK
ncbi:MAG: hypothetical protein HYS32_04520 [Candidatus Woesearchaeota archaeon]|nr:MAG: hypothetical protein HYS32_04520 [Candidatus Woesearchaeota archaeon]